jgi:hypothetical protein
MATFNTDIYQGNRPKSVDEFNAIADEADARKLSGESNRLQLALQARQLRAAQQSEDEQNRLMTLMRGLPATATNVDRINALRGGGFYNQADAAAKADVDLRDKEAGITSKGVQASKDAADADKLRIANGLQQFEAVGQIMAGVSDQATYDSARQQAAKVFGPEFAAKIPPQYDPATVEANKARALSVKDRLEQEWKAKGYDLDVRKADDTNARAAAERAVQMRGQNLTAETSRGNSAATVAAARETAAATRDAAQIQTGFQNESNLRKEFENLPEIKNYKQAFPSYAAIKDAAKRSTPQSDINIVYGIAKLYDPTSVVREGEYATVANSPSIPEKVKGYAQYIAGGGKLSPETKKQLLAEAEGRLSTYKAEADKAVNSYTGIATRRGMDPKSVFQAMGDVPVGGASPAAGPVNMSAIDAELARRAAAKKPGK